MFDGYFYGYLTQAYCRYHRIAPTIQCIYLWHINLSTVSRYCPDIMMRQFLEVLQCSICIHEPYTHKAARFDSSPPGQNGRHFADNISKCIFVNEKCFYFD